MFDIDKFKNPPSRFRGMPFWGWNCKLSKSELTRQIEVFKEMGFGGFQMHPRTGLDTQYLGKEYMQAVKACCEKAKEEGMYACLYDEDRWPSGFAGGFVTKNKKFAARQLLFTPFSYEEYGEVNYEPNFSTTMRRAGNGELVACFDIVLDESGRLISYKKVGADDAVQGTKWYAYVETALDSPWFNGFTNVDVADDEAIDEFLNVTHETYFKEIGEMFGDVVPTIFTDEPQVTFKSELSEPFEKADVLLAWTRKFREEYKKAYGEEFLDVLPLVVWEGEEASKARYRYHNLIAEMFAANFCDKIGKWCKEHNIKFTGHMISEGSLRNQTRNIGDVMRAYRGMQVPGVDNLCDDRDYVAIKQAVSSSIQTSNGDVLCELYGVTNWDYDFRDLKFQGDWQAAIGVNRRCHHLSWASMKGEAKRDYPLTFSYHAPWYDKFQYLENHFSRINYIMSLGKTESKLCVINPVESLWTEFGNRRDTLEKQNETDRIYQKTVKSLMFNHIEFDCVSEANMQSLLKSSEKGLALGNCCYDTIVLPVCKTIRKSTIEILTDAQKRGVKLIFVVVKPFMVEGCVQNDLFEGHKAILVEELADKVKEYRSVNVTDENGQEETALICRISHADDGNKYIFAAFADRCDDFKTTLKKKKIKFWIDGEYSVNILDTFTGEEKEAEVMYEGGKTIITSELYAQSSILLKLELGKTTAVLNEKNEVLERVELPDRVKYELSEPNVLLIDRAEFYLDGKKITDTTDILKGDNQVRKLLGLPLRMDVVKEPWCICEKEKHTVTMVARFESRIEAAARLGIEYFDGMEISFNEQTVEQKECGWYTDICIKTFDIGRIKKGENIICIKMPFGEKTDIENMFILGDFGVYAEGEKVVIDNLPDTIAFSDITKQGLAFYGGNITYLLEGQKGDIIENLCYIGQGADADGDESITFAPYSAKLSNFGKITVYGSRVNTFGSIHNSGTGVKSHPNSWRTEGDNWSDDYLIKPWGIMKKPTVARNKLSDICTR